MSDSLFFRNIWTGNVFLQEKPGSHSEHNVVLVDWTHCQVFIWLWYRLWNTKLSGLNFIHDCKGHCLVNRYLSLICFLMIGSWFNLIGVSVESRHLLFAQLKPWHKSVQGNMWICLSPQIGRASRWVGRNLWKTPIYHSDTHLIKFTCQKISYKPAQKFRLYSCP